MITDYQLLKVTTDNVTFDVSDDSNRSLGNDDIHCITVADFELQAGDDVLSLNADQL